MRIIVPVSIALLTFFTLCRPGLCNEPVLHDDIVHDAIIHVKTPVTPVGADITLAKVSPADIEAGAIVATVTIYNAGGGNSAIRKSRSAFRFPTIDGRQNSIGLAAGTGVVVYGTNNTDHLLTLIVTSETQYLYDRNQRDDTTKTLWGVTKEPMNSLVLNFAGARNHPVSVDVYPVTIETAAWTE